MALPVCIESTLSKEIRKSLTEKYNKVIIVYIHKTYWATIANPLHGGVGYIYTGNITPVFIMRNVKGQQELAITKNLLRMQKYLGDMSGGGPYVCSSLE